MVIVTGCNIVLFLIICAQNVYHRRKANVLRNTIADRDMDIAILKDVLDRSEQKITEIKEVLGNA